MIFYNNINPKGLAEYIFHQQHFQRDIEANTTLRDAIQEFHSEIGLYPKNYFNIIADIENSIPIIRIAHQPNFLPYSNLILQLRFLQQLYDELLLLGLKTVPVVFFVDQDKADTSWFAESPVWNPFVKNHIEWFKYPLSSNRGVIADQVVADDNVMESVVKGLVTYGRIIDQYIIKGKLALTSEDQLNLSLFPDKKVKSVAAATGYSWASVAYREAIAPNVVFLRFSSLNSPLRSHYVHLSEKIGPDRDGLYQLWTICDRCGRRSVVAKDIDKMHYSCVNEVCSMYRQYRKLIDQNPLIPKVIVDSLTDTSYFKIIGGTSYSSSMAHITKTQDVAKMLKLPYSPEAVWRMDIPPSSFFLSYIERFYSKVNTPAIVKKILYGGRLGLGFYLCFKDEMSHLLDRYQDNINKINRYE